ncbi:MAG TPA: hypothetical protein DD629_02775 [Treponema sp.]|nr:hypothetical protein [Treponema sp.]
MDKKKLSISAVDLFSNELPDVKVFLEDNGILYTFSGVYDGCRSLSSKLLRLMQNDETEKKRADK